MKLTFAVKKAELGNEPIVEECSIIEDDHFSPSVHNGVN